MEIFFVIQNFINFQYRIILDFTKIYIFMDKKGKEIYIIFIFYLILFIFQLILEVVYLTNKSGGWQLIAA